MLTKDFWNERAAKYGHTGHADPFLYCFDQEARRYAVQKIITRLIPEAKRDKALDYGCGSGDFAPILKEKFSLVVGYDFAENAIHIAEHLNTQDVRFTTDKKDVWDQGLYDLILSVSVLQSFEMSELEEALRELSLLMVTNGYLVALEFFQCEKSKATSGKEGITLEQWTELLEKNNLSVVSRHTFYNPVHVPCQSWKEYKTDFWNRLLLPIRHTAFAKTVFSNKAKKLIRHYDDVVGVDETNFYIYVIQKVPHAN